MRTIGLLLLAGCQAGVASMGDAGAPPDLAPACPPGAHAGPGGCVTDVRWSRQRSLAPGRDHHAALVAEGDAGAGLYVLGGTDHFASYLLDDAWRATLGGDGAIGEWHRLGRLPLRLAGHAATAVGGHLVVTGGVTVDPMGRTHLTDRTWVAPLAADGSIGAWRAGPPVPPAREHHGLVVSGRAIYVVGGLIGRAATSHVARAELQPDGTLGAWADARALPEPRSHHATVLAEKAIWVIGGLRGDPAAGAPSLAGILRAELAPDGALGPWQEAGALPAALSTHSAAASGGALWVFGGYEADLDFTGHVRRAALLPGGGLGPWQDAAPLPVARGHVLETPVWRRHVYSVGGSIADLSVLTDAYVGEFH